MTRTFFAFFALATLGACATTQPLVQCKPTPLQTDQNTPKVLATVDGLPIGRADLGPDFDDHMREADEEAAQKKFQLTWIMVEDAISAKLLAEEATRRNQSVAELRKQEIDSHVKTPTPEEVRAIYDQNKDVINVSFEVAQEPIKAQLQRERQREAERTFIDSLRDHADVRYAIPSPVLQRFSVEQGGGAAWGPANAPVTLLVYADFQCPYCGRSRHIIARLRELYPDKLRVIFRHFPLPQHPRARAAAEAAQCALAQNKFWPFHDLLFDHSDALAAEDFNHYAQAAGLDVAAFQTCLTAPQTKAAVDAQIESAERLNVQGTPALFLNGGRIKGVLPVPLMQSLIEAELQQNAPAP